MICAKCGSENADGATVCGACGVALVIPEQGAIPPPPIFTPNVKPVTVNGLAIFALICGLLTFCTIGIAGIIGFVLSIIAVRQATKSNGRISKALPIISFLVSFGFTGMYAMGYYLNYTRKQRIMKYICINNSKQIGLSLTMYMYDYDDTLPAQYHWCDDILPYVKNREIFVCPLAPKAKSAYAFNDKLNSLRTTTSADTSSTVMLFESTGGWNQYGGPQIAEDRHGIGVIICFMDGHVRSYPMATLNDTSYMYWDPKDAAKSNEDDKANSNGTN